MRKFILTCLLLGAITCAAVEETRLVEKKEYKPRSLYHGLRGLAVTGTFASIIGGVGAVSNAWKGIVDAFKTTRTNTLKEKIAGIGYDKMFTTSICDRIEELEAAYLGEFLEDFKKIVQVPSNPKIQDSLYNAIKSTKYSSKRTFNGNSMAFTKENGGTSVFVTFLHNRNREKNTYNIIYTYFSAEFSLAPDLFVFNNGLSVLGGIYSNNEDYFKEVPRSITDNDVKSLMNFMEMMNFKSIYSSLGIDVPMPEF